MPGREVSIRDQLILQPAVGLVKFVRQGKVLLSQATAGVTYSDAAETSLVLATRQGKRLDLAGHSVTYGVARDSLSVSAADDELELTWQLVCGDEMRLRLEAHNIGTHPVHVEELRVLDVDARHGGALGLGSTPRNWRFYQNGWQSWSPAFARHIPDGIWVNPNTAEYRTQHQPHAGPEGESALSSEWFTVLVAEQPAARVLMPPPALLFGFISTGDQLADIRLQARPRFERLCATSYADGAVLAPGARLSSETLLFVAQDNPLSLLDLYAARLGETMGARVGTRTPSGWCTWYYFFGEESADDVLANLATIQQQHLPLDVMLIDDGYETHIGDWLDVQAVKYPHGMQAVAQQISASGLRPGIWTAPFAVSSASKLFASHPDWVLRDGQGQPVLAWQHWGVDIYALDLSLPAVLTWLGETFHTLAEEWGFHFFKVDFLFAAALPGVRSDPDVTRAKALRRGLETIRNAIGDRFLLGCGAPLGPSVGLVDAMRIGTDVSIDWRPFWQDLSSAALSNSMLNAVTRSFMHRRLWLNDPDCLLLRPRRQDSNLTLHEARMLATIVGLSGGLTLDSDHLPALPHARLELLRRVLPSCGESATPLDLFENERPQQLVLPVKTAWGSWTLLALLNWEKRSRTTRVSLADLGLPSRSYHVYDYWRRRYLGVRRDEVVIEKHQPHEAVLLLLKPVSERSQLLASTFHVTQGAVEVKDVQPTENGLVVELLKAGVQSGQLLFAIPSDHPAPRVLVNGRPRKLRPVAAGVWEVSFSLSGQARVELLLD